MTQTLVNSSGLKSQSLTQCSPWFQKQKGKQYKVSGNMFNTLLAAPVSFLPSTCPLFIFELPGRFCDTRISSYDYEHTQDQLTWS